MTTQIDDLSNPQLVTIAVALLNGDSIFVDREDIAIKSPGDGLSPYEIDKVIGRVTRQPLKEDDDITIELLNGAEHWSEAAS